MKILLDTSSFFPVVGGVQLVVHHLAEALCQLGQDVTVSGFFSQDNKKLMRHYRFEDKSTFRGRRFFKRLKLYKKHQQFIIFKIINKVRPDIIHCHYLYPTAYEMLAVLKKYKLNIPVVATAHGIDIQKFPAINYGLRLDSDIENKIVDVIQKTTNLIAISDDVYDTYLQLGADRGKLEKIPNLIAYNSLAESARSTKKSMGFDEKLPVLLAVGRNHPKKGYDRLFRILKILEDKNIVLQIIIIGKGVSQLKIKVREYNLKNSIELIDYAAPAGLQYRESTTLNIKNYYDIADIFAMTSYVESFGLVTAEAMAAGKYVIGFDSSGSNSIIKDSYNGYLIKGDEAEFADKIEFLINHKNTQIRENAVQYAKNFSYRNVARKHLDLYKKTMNIL